MGADTETGRIGGRLGFLALGLFLWGLNSAWARSPEAWLARMARALTTLNYEGILVYAQGDRLETMRIQHRVEGDGVRERLESLSGPPGVVTRHRGRIACQLAGHSSPSAKYRVFSVPRLVSRVADIQNLSPYYRIQSLGTARIAGRQTQIVAILPRDRFRYGYRFCIDEDTGLPLKIELLDTEGRPLEQLVFTSVTIEGAPETRATSSAGPSPTPPAIDPSPWRFQDLPAGFALILADRLTSGGGGDQAITHFLFSDGLATISLYLERDAEGLLGASHLGTIQALGERRGAYQVTAVGEVPQETLQALVSGVRYGGNP